MGSGAIEQALDKAEGMKKPSAPDLAQENEMLRELLREAADSMERMQQDNEISLRIEAARLTGGKVEEAKRLYNFFKTGDTN